MDDLYERVDRALDEIRPYIHSHSGEVNIVDVTDDGIVKLQMAGHLARLDSANSHGLAATAVVRQIEGRNTSCPVTYGEELSSAGSARSSSKALWSARTASPTFASSMMQVIRISLVEIISML